MFNNSFFVINFLLKFGVDVNVCDGKSGKMIFYYVVEMGNMIFMDYIL